jgi:positive regulator of sigma E activity
MPREIGIVTGINKDKIILQLNGGEHCSHCAAKSVCAVNENTRQLELTYHGTVNPGEKVEIEYTEKNKIAIAVIIFLLPLLFLISGYVLGNLLFHTTLAAISGSILGLIIGATIPYFVNQWNEKKGIILPRIVKKA